MISWLILQKLDRTLKALNNLINLTKLLFFGLLIQKDSHNLIKIYMEIIVQSWHLLREDKNKFLLLLFLLLQQYNKIVSLLTVLLKILT
jgi:hypothetical protein